MSTAASCLGTAPISSRRQLRRANARRTLRTKCNSLDFKFLRHPKNLSGSDLIAAKKINENNAQAPHQITQSQQVRRISARRERISAVSAWAQWGAPPLQPSKTTRNFGLRERAENGFVGRLAEQRELRSKLSGVSH